MTSINLSAFALIEPEEPFCFYYPSWLNTWESHLYNQSLKSTGAQSWCFKRFGCDSALYAREMIRKPACTPYLEALEQAADSALQQLAAKERMRLLRSRTAFIYVDAWGESGLFEHVASALQVAMIDTLPKNLLKKFSVNAFTCKVRGERFAFMQALTLAQDYLLWALFDFVVICAGWRAIPLLVFSAAQQTASASRNPAQINFAVERTGCFILSRQEGGLRVNVGGYRAPADPAPSEGGTADINVLAGLDCYRPPRDGAASAAETISLSAMYGDSGCLAPALGWIYLQQRAAAATLRVLLPDAAGGCHYFDTWDASFTAKEA